MRKAFLVLAACGLLPAAQAQTERGSKLLSASLGNLSYSHQKGGSAISVAVYPAVGWFVANNLALGTSLPLSYGRQKAKNVDYLYREYSYGLGPFARYYVPGSGRHRVFAEVGAEFSRRHLRAPEYRQVAGPTLYMEQKSSFFGYHGAVGYSYFLVPTAALEATAGYLHIAKEPADRLRSVIDVRVGFSVYLPAGGSN